MEVKEVERGVAIRAELFWHSDSVKSIFGLEIAQNGDEGLSVVQEC